MVVKQLAVQQTLAMILAASSTRMARCGCGSLSALIYRGKGTCEGSPEAIGKMLKAIYPDASVTYAGPDQAEKINATNLRAVDIFAQGGGPGIAENKNEVIKIDWDLPTRCKPGISGEKRCVSFPDGITYQRWFPLAHDSETTVIGTYSDDGNVAAMINHFGDGFVANIGAHPEVDMDWLDDEDDETSGAGDVRHDIAYDFVQSMLDEVDYYGEKRRLSGIEKH